MLTELQWAMQISEPKPACQLDAAVGLLKQPETKLLGPLERLQYLRILPFGGQKLTFILIST